MLSVYPALPAPVFTASRRDEKPSVNAILVGPGEYGVPPGACEPQFESRKKSCPTIKFGRGYRKGFDLVKESVHEPTPGKIIVALNASAHA